MAVNEDQASAGQRAERKMGDGIARQAITGTFENGLKRQLRDRGNVRKTPVFIVNGREAEFSEAGNSGFPEWKYPRWLLRFILETGKFLQIRLSFLHIGFSFGPKWRP